MAELAHALKDRRLLVVEDDYLLADDLARALEELGAKVLGPAGSVHDALCLIAREEQIDAALLDINLRGQPAFPVADALAARGVRFVFTTGYDRVALPDRYANVPMCNKPTDAPRLANFVTAALRP